MNGYNLLARTIAIFNAFSCWNVDHQWMEWVGSKGIFPWTENKRRLSRYGHLGYWIQPTWCWLVDGDAMLWWVPKVGVVVSLWTAYSPSTLGAFFSWSFIVSTHAIIPWLFDFPWFAALSEAGFLCIWVPMFGQDPTLRLLFHTFLFRLMFGFGKTKYEPTGTDSWTQKARYVKDLLIWQPMATPLGWWVWKHVPLWMSAVANVFTFWVEVVAPFCYFVDVPWLRAVAGLSTMSLMVGIQLVGNYGIFNLLTAVLSSILLFDSAPTLELGEPRWVQLLWLGLIVLNILKIPFNSWTNDRVWYTSCLDRVFGRLGFTPILPFLRYTGFFKIVNPYGIFQPDNLPPFRQISVCQIWSKDGTWTDVPMKYHAYGQHWSGAWHAPWFSLVDYLVVYDAAGISNSFFMNQLAPKQYITHPTFRECLHRIVAIRAKERDWRILNFEYAPETPRRFVSTYSISNDTCPSPPSFDTLFFEKNVGVRSLSHETRAFLSSLTFDNLRERRKSAPPSTIQKYQDEWIAERNRLFRSAIRRLPLTLQLVSNYLDAMDATRFQILPDSPDVRLAELFFYTDEITSSAHLRNCLIQRPQYDKFMNYIANRSMIPGIYHRAKEFDRWVAPLWEVSQSDQPH